MIGTSAQGFLFLLSVLFLPMAFFGLIWMTLWAAFLYAISRARSSR